MQKNTFSNRLKSLLKQKQLTLAEVAKAIDISTPSVHRWTRGGEIEYANLRALADFLQVNWIWLRYGDEALEGLQTSVANDEAIAEDRRKYIGAIMENEARLNLAQEMARIVTWEWNVLTDELTASLNAENIFGRPINELRYQVLPFATMDIEKLIGKFSANGFVQEWDFSLSKIDGLGDLWFASRGKLMLDNHGRPSKMIGVSIDITQRKTMQQALEKNEYVLRKVIETIPVGLWIADQEGKITTANPEAQRIWGGAKYVGLDQYGEYKGRWESTGKEIGSGGWTLARAVRNGETSHGEIVNIEAFDGEMRTMIMSAIPLLNVENKIIGAIEVNQDITELKRTEESLRFTVEQWNSIFEQPLVGIGYYKRDSDVLHVNSRFAELLDSTIEAISRETFEKLLSKETLLEFQRHINDMQTLESANFILDGKLTGTSGKVKKLRLYVIANKKPTSIFKTLVFAVGSA